MIKNVLKVFSAGFLAQVLNFLSFPIITVWYGPAVFGEYAVFAFFVAFLPMIITLRMEMATLQDPNSSEMNTLVFIPLINSLFIFAICSIISLFFSNEIKLEIFLIFLTAFFASIQNIGICIANLKERYWAISISRILFPVFFFMMVYFLRDESMIYPLAISHFFASFMCALFIVKASSYTVKIVSLKEVITVLQKNLHYIKFDLPSNIFNVCGLLLPSYLILVFFNQESSGLYFLAYKLIAAPLSALTLAIGYVYRREAVKEYKVNDSFYVITKRMLMLLMLLSALMLIGFYSLGQWIFELLFQEDWQAALPIISILIPAFALKLVASPLSFSFYIVNKLKLDLCGQISFVILVACAVFSGYLLNDFIKAIYFISIATGFFYLFYCVKSIQFSRGI